MKHATDHILECSKQLFETVVHCWIPSFQQTMWKQCVRPVQSLTNPSQNCDWAPYPRQPPPRFAQIMSNLRRNLDQKVDLDPEKKTKDRNSAKILPWWMMHVADKPPDGYHSSTSTKWSRRGFCGTLSSSQRLPVTQPADPSRSPGNSHEKWP